MLCGVDIEFKDACKFLLPSPAPCLEPRKYSRINVKVIVGLAACSKDDAGFHSVMPQV